MPALQADHQTQPRQSCYAIALRPYRFICAAGTAVTYCEGSLIMRAGEFAPNANSVWARSTSQPAEVRHGSA